MKVERAGFGWADDLGREREVELEPPSDPVSVREVRRRSRIAEGLATEVEEEDGG